jgi:hypothetical protein
MWNGNLIIDAVAHAYDFVESNRVEDCSPEEYAGLCKFVYNLGHAPLESTEPGFLLNDAEWTAGWTPEELASVYFEESDVDVMVYHGVEIAAFFKRGSSPWQIGVELKKLYPDRVLLYAPIDPLKGLGELETMERLVEESPINGFKFYPSNGIIDHDRNRAMTTMYDDPENAFPFFEKGRELGVNVMAIHKAWPVGPGPLDKDKVDDVNSAAVAFPDLTFEVVHSGWAFLEDCGIQLMTHPNIWANLEAVANFALRQPRRFAHVLGTLRRYGGDDRIMWGTGCPLGHPQPLVEAFANFQMPEDMQEGYGYAPIDDEAKAKIFGGNMARLHNLDVAAIEDAVSGDEWSERRKAYAASPTGPWRELRERVEAGVAA